MITRILRGILTVLLLAIVWKNSHWSVALCLTLIAVNIEMTLIHLEKIRGYRNERSKVEWQLFNKIKKANRRVDEVTKSIAYVRAETTAKQPKEAAKIVRNEPKN